MLYNRTEKCLHETYRFLLGCHGRNLCKNISGNAHGAYEASIIRSFHLSFRIKPPEKSGVFCFGHVLLSYKVRIGIAPIHFFKNVGARNKYILLHEPDVRRRIFHAKVIQGLIPRRRLFRNRGCGIDVAGLSADIILYLDNIEDTWSYWVRCGRILFRDFDRFEIR